MKILIYTLISFSICVSCQEKKHKVSDSLKKIDNHLTMIESLKDSEEMEMEMEKYDELMNAVCYQICVTGIDNENSMDWLGTYRITRNDYINWVDWLNNNEISNSSECDSICSKLWGAQN